MLDLTNSPIIAAYKMRTPRSAELAKQAAEVLASGVASESRVLDPYPLYIKHAAGPRKWDVDGNGYVDYWGGHGSLMLGHCHPVVMKAVQEQLNHGTHYGSCHEFEVRWSELVKQLIPSAELVRFTSSGTEATILGVRLARAFTGKKKLIRFAEHYHGWTDLMVARENAPPRGVVSGIGSDVLVARAGDIDSVVQLLDNNNDVAAVIIEPIGANTGLRPMRTEFLGALRKLTQERGVILIFDEVVTAFRIAPGGAQAFYNVKPDLTSLAKVLCGGLPGGAIAGRKDIMDLLSVKATKALGQEVVPHQGTFNANPVAAAAGIATLEIIANTDACAKANEYGETIRKRLNEMFEEEKVEWAAYGAFSKFHIFHNANAKRISFKPTEFEMFDYPASSLMNDRTSPMIRKMRLGMMLHGVDLTGGGSGSFVSATHGDQEMEDTVEGLRKTLHMLRQEGEI
jgi:glutamate-1-semialdehyde 2,1-aminomutase